MKDVNVRVEHLEIWLRKRGYPYYLIKEQVEMAHRLFQSDENNSTKVSGVL